MTGLAVDSAGARPAPGTLVDAGVTDFLGYVDNAPTRAYLDDLAGAGVRFTFGYETAPDRAQSGAVYGMSDAQHTNDVADAHGYPALGPLWVCASDGTATRPSANGSLIADYAMGWASRSPRPLFAYGNRYAVDAFNAGVVAVDRDKLVVVRLERDGGWLPIPWGADRGRDLLGQDANTAAPVAGVDLDRPFADWWTAGPPAPPTAPTMGATTMCAIGHHWKDGTQPGPADDWYAIDGGLIVHQFGGDRAPYGIPQEVAPWANAGAPVVPLSDGDLAVLKRRSGWS